MKETSMAGNMKIAMHAAKNPGLSDRKSKKASSTVRREQLHTNFVPRTQRASQSFGAQSNLALNGRADLKFRQQATQSEVVTDQAVPEGHKGLHEFLYGEGGAEAHDDSQAAVQAREVCISARRTSRWHTFFAGLI